MTNCYQLKKIILIDSFWPGKTVLLKLDGHTNLSGTNGAGKTTFLRLMQLFWGERPSNIIGSSGSKKSFLDYYLPRTSSYLVYEYQRPHEQICHVMVQSDGRAARYKFIDATYRQDFYINEAGYSRDSQSIERFYRTNGVETSKFVAVDDYCSIIQSHQLTGGKKDLRLLQKHYAMAATPMNHIEKVIASVIEKIGDFDIIKQMLIDISRSKLSQTFLQSEDEQHPFQLNKQHIDAWLADLSAAREIEARRTEFDGLLQTLSELKQILKSQSHLHFLARNKHKLTQQEIETLDNNLKQLVHKRNQLLETHKKAVEPKDDALMETQSRLKNLSYQIEALESQKLAFEAQSAESFAIKAAKVEQFVTQQLAVQAELDALANKTKEINHFYEKKLSELQHSHDKQDHTQQQQRIEAELSQSQSLHQADTEFAQRKAQLLFDKNQREHPYKEQHSQFLTEFAIKQNQLKNPPISAALLEQQQKNREARDSANQVSRLAYQAQTEAQHIYQQCLNFYQQTDHELGDKKQELIRVKERHADCQKRLNPAPDSLQNYLEQEVEGWEQTIGRVIAPELLDFTDLNPQWNDHPGNDFYGLNINLEPLANRSFLTADKSRLTEQEIALFKQVSKLHQQCDELETSLQASNKRRDEAKSTLEDTQQRVRQAEKVGENLQGEAIMLTDQIKAETAKLKQQLEQDSIQLSADIKACAASLADIDKQHLQASRELENEHIARKAIIKSDFENLLTTLHEQMETDNQHFKLEQSRIEQQLKRDLSDSGADESTVTTLITKLNEAKRLEKEAREYQRKAQEYQDWLLNRWKEHPSLCRQHDDCQSQQRQLQDELEQLKQDFQRQRTQLHQQINALEEQLKKNNSLLVQLEQCMDQLRNCQPAWVEGQPEYAAGTLPRLVQENIKERKRLERDIQAGKQTLIQLFNKHQHSQLAEAWSQALNDAAYHNEFFQAEELEIEQPLNNVLQMVSQVKQATAQQIELHANSVNNFYRDLRSFETAIKSTGNELSKYVSEERYFTALGEITVNIRSKMSDLEYWQALKKFGDYYNQYRDNSLLNSQYEIPDSLVQAMGDLTSLLPATGVRIRHLALFDIEFSIFENGQLKHARNSRELKDVSSTGLSYLALITFFTGVTAMLRKQNPTVVCWPIDELGDLAPENIEAMMNLLSKQNIHILSATPTADRHVLGLFNRRYLLTQQKLHEVELPQSKLELLLKEQIHQEAAHV